VDLASHIHELDLPGIHCGRQRHELSDGRKNRLGERRLPGLSVTSLKKKGNKMLGTKAKHPSKPEFFCMMEKDSSE
jgi:hypothetical protein